MCQCFNPKKNLNLITMEENKIKVEPDPDYSDMPEIKKIKTENNEDQIKSYEKLVQVIQREFQKDINYKREEIHKIQQQLLKAQKTLHLLRYIVVRSFYENKDVKLTSNTNEVPVLPSTSNTQDDLISDENRIHPAVKKLIGKKPINYEPYRTRNKNKSITRVGENVTIKEEIDEQKHVPKVIKVENVPVVEEIIKKEEVDENNVPVRNRDKNKYRILVGNISKWMPSNSINDNSTHKWMIYVRGPKENPDISHIVKKVRFFLHPSYQPNDIVDVQEAPFHLSRRGWGEFPLRVQIYFKNSRNKPIDIIHHIKLDRTYSGRQTMGGETLVDVYLYDKDVIDETETSNKKQRIDPNNYYIKEDVFNENYFDTKDLFPVNEVVKKPKTEEKIVKYCNISNCDNVSNFIDICTENIKELRNIEDENNAIYGVEEKLFPELDSVDINPPDFSFNDLDDNPISLLNEMGIKEIPQLPQSYDYSSRVKINFESEPKDYDNVYLEDHCYTKLKEPSEPPKEVKQIVIKPKYSVGKNWNSLDANVIIDKDKYKLDVPLEYFTTLPQIIYFMFKNLPLYTELANEITYTCLYPYASKNLQEFLSWNPIKQFCSEWYRAKHIKKFLVDKNLEGHEDWSVKSILLYGQAHGFSPIQRNELFNKKSIESGKSLPNRLETITETNTLTCVIPIKDLLDYKSTLKYTANDNNDIDIISSKPISSKKLTKKDDTCYTIENELPCRYVSETVKQIGIELEPEEIIPGVFEKTSEQIILKSVMCLAEELIRKSLANNIVDKNMKISDIEISKNDIFNTLLEREEFSIFLNCGLGKNIIM